MGARWIPSLGSALLLAVALGVATTEAFVANGFVEGDERPMPDFAASIIGSPALNAEFETAYPYTVSLRRRSDQGYFCSGVLIGKKHVLTAAHCVDSSLSSGDSRPQVVVGSASSTQTSGPGVQVLSTENVYIHPGYRSMRFPDLAILELSHVANQNPVRIPTSTTFLPRHGEDLKSLGWGRRSQTSVNAEVLQVVTVKYLSFRSCRRQLGGFLFPFQICVGGDGAGSCSGDDGGPIVLPGQSREEDVLVGIVGASHVCGTSTRPDVHVRVAPYIDWIKQNGGSL